jgi:hypothetical protein
MRIGMAMTWGRRGGLAIAALLLIASGFGYHRIIQRSVLRHPEVALQTVREHCRYVLGKQLGKMPKEELSARFRLCDEIRVKSVEAAGGVLDPVMIRVILEDQPKMPLDQKIFVFKLANSTSRNLSFLTSLGCLSGDSWKFNSATSYSDRTFRFSF